MELLYVWLDTNLVSEAGWRAITQGPHPERYFFTSYENLKDFVNRHHLEIFMKSPPEGGYDDGLTIGDGHQFRREPVRRPGVMREGIHALLGGGIGWVYFLGEPIMAVLLFIGFLAYEITEGLRIKDWAYRDIGGALIGLAAVTAGALLERFMPWPF